MSHTPWVKLVPLILLLGLGTLSYRLHGDDVKNGKDPTLSNALDKVTKGRQVFRFDTFGDETFWGDTLKLHQAIGGAAHGGVGPGVSPRTALAVGLKVDVDALPSNVREQLLRGAINLDDSATTLLLLQANAVIGVTGVFNSSGMLQSMGIQCALCHSTVDNSLPNLCAGAIQPNPGTGCVGHRMDGWANRDLNVGAIVALAPDLSAFVNLLSATQPGITQSDVRTVLSSWGPGKFDAELILDGFQPCPNQQWRNNSDARSWSYSDSIRLWTRRREPSHVDRLGFGSALERLRRQSRNAWEG